VTIHIRGLAFEAVLGVLAHERTTPQPVIVDATFTYTYEERAFLDYAQIAETIRETMQRERFHLVEEALTHLFALLKAKFPQIETAKIEICKPDILPDCRVCVGDFREFL
jgi:dihydroneopterin aldolase